MGLTIHWDFESEDGVRDIRKIVEALRQFAMDLPFAEVADKIVDINGDECDFNKCADDDPLRWLKIQAQKHVRVDEHTTYCVAPKRIIGFGVWPGERCEDMNIMLCEYPKTLHYTAYEYKWGHGDVEVKSRKKIEGPRWSGGSFCKTQYASNVSTEHFVRCHLLVIAMLERSKELGILKEVIDEGEYWEKRDVEALGKEVGEWNTMIAGLAGALKDIAGEGEDVIAPITERSDFEQLEAKGAENEGAAAIANIIKRIDNNA
jgi:hypothetical protein